MKNPFARFRLPEEIVLRVALRDKVHAPIVLRKDDTVTLEYNLNLPDQELKITVDMRLEISGKDCLRRTIFDLSLYPKAVEKL